MSEQIENKNQLKNIINAILENKRILVYRNEIKGETDDTYVLLYNHNDSDYDILTIPFVINELSPDREFISFLFETEKFDINNLSNLIVEYIDYLKKSCIIKGYVYGELLRLLTMLNYKMSIDYTMFNKHSFSGKIRYTVILDLDKTATISEKIEYCNYCRHDNSTNVGIQKCVTYKLE